MGLGSRQNHALVLASKAYTELGCILANSCWKQTTNQLLSNPVKMKFWGAKPVDKHTLVGVNALGRLLMELREDVKTEGQRSILAGRTARYFGFLPRRASY